MVDPTVEPPPASADRVGFAVAFSGPLAGTVYVRMPEVLTKIIAGNLLGADEPVEDWLARDTAGELANVICGHVLPTLFGSSAVFRIDAPRGIGATDSLGEEMGATALAVEGHRVEVGLCLLREQAGAA